MCMAYPLATNYSKVRKTIAPTYLMLRCYDQFRLKIAPPQTTVRLVVEAVSIYLCPFRPVRDSLRRGHMASKKAPFRPTLTLSPVLRSGQQRGPSLDFHTKPLFLTFLVSILRSLSSHIKNSYI